MQTNAPGRGKLKVTGILYIIFGALGLLLSLALLAGGGLLLAAEGGLLLLYAVYYMQGQAIM